ncbi:MAG TPA: alpha-1,2-fucosyltransferase [Candidatus Gastranaerophilaceae bacterium]|nr:alpha-1,2-fucosyltransferase [Candidatus Gastranaerophilaceae bacterium]
MKRNIVKFNGGLGNQMFQWAFARALEKITGMPSFMDMTYFSRTYARPYELDIFAAEIKKIKGFFSELMLETLWKLRREFDKKSFLGTYLYEEPHFGFDKNVFKIGKSAFIHGFFQSEKYFKKIEKQIRKDFTFKSEPDFQNQDFLEKINASNSISLHIRRGDYVQKKKYQKLYASCSLEYYKRGVEYIAQKFENPTLFIFSDDIDWAKENLKLPYKNYFVAHNLEAKSFEDMRLMSACKHNIIANSSFSWWGAWLNQNPEKIVIAPQKWFNDESINQSDIIPENWIKLGN